MIILKSIVGLLIIANNIIPLYSNYRKYKAMRQRRIKTFIRKYGYDYAAVYWLDTPDTFTQYIKEIIKNAGSKHNP